MEDGAITELPRIASSLVSAELPDFPKWQVKSANRNSVELETGLRPIWDPDRPDKIMLRAFPSADPGKSLGALGLRIESVYPSVEYGRGKGYYGRLSVSLKPAINLDKEVQKVVEKTCR